MAINGQCMGKRRCQDAIHPCKFFWLGPTDGRPAAKSCACDLGHTQEGTVAIMTIKMLFAALVGLCGLGCAVARAETYEAVSPPYRVALIELYTSEGCSSCPPADRWLGEYVNTPSRSRYGVALTLHVDYWDGLGWKDPFAQRIFTARQNRLAHLARAELIYTPEVFLNGREFRDWDSPSVIDAELQRVHRQSAEVRLGLRVSDGEHGELAIDLHVVPTRTVSPRRSLQAYVALYENDLTRLIEGGENQGVTLHHTHVVRRWLGPLHLTRGAGRFHATVAGDHTLDLRKVHVAAFVEDGATGEILQALDLERRESQ